MWPPISNSNACLRTFLVQRLEDVLPAFNHHIPEAFRADLAGVVILTHSYSYKEFSSFGAELSCPCYHVTTLGTSGWNAKLGINHEVEQEGQGVQFGSPGVSLGGVAVTIIAIRNQAKRIVLSSGSAPGTADGALGHIVFGSHEHQGTVAEFLASPKQAVCAGGITLKIWKMTPASSWTEVDLVIVTLMDDGDTLFNVSCTEILNPEPSCRDSGRDMIQSLPAGYRLEFLGYFPCIMRGQNRYGEPNVESKGLDSIIGQDVPMLGFCTLGEIGNNTSLSNPNGWNACRKSSTSIYLGATVFACFATRSSTKSEVKSRGLEPFALVEKPPEEDLVRSVKSSLAWLHSSPSVLSIASERQETSPADASASLSISQRLQSWFGLGMCCQCPDSGAKAPKELIVSYPTSTAAPQGPQADASLTKMANFARVLRGIPLSSCGGGSTEACGFWIPGQFSNEKLFGLSRKVEVVDVFLSQVIRPPPGANEKMWAFSKSLDATAGAADIALRLCNNDPTDVHEVMGQLTFWVDRACVDQDSGDEKMRIIHDHLEDFLVNARYVCCLISEQYFTRLWCIFEVCCSFAYRDINTIIVGGFSVAMRLPYAQQIADSILHLSVASAQCFDPADRHIIEDKITANFVSIEHFETFAKLAALGILVRDALALMVEYDNLVMWELWLSTVRACQFQELEAAMKCFDITKVQQQLFEMHPDSRSATQTNKRLKECNKTFVRPWFDAKVAPLILRERARAVIRA